MAGNKEVAGRSSSSPGAASSSGYGAGVLALLTAAYCVAYVSAESLPPMFGPALSSLRVTTGISASELATMPSVLSFGSVFGGLLGGVVFDLQQVKQSLPAAHIALSVGLLVTAAVNAFTPHAESMVAMSAITLFLGLFNGLFRAGANCQILRVHGDSAGPYMQALHLFGGMGRLVAPLALRFFIGSQSESDLAGLKSALSKAYLSVSCLPLVATVFLLALSALLPTRAKSPGSEKAERNEKPRENSSSSSSSVEAFVLLGALTALTMGAQATFQSYASAYAIAVGFSTADSMMVSAVFGSSFTLGRVLSVPLSVRASARTMVFVDAIGVTAAAVAMPQSLWVGTAIFGLSMASMFPSILNFAKQEVPGMSSKGITLIMQSGSLGTMFAPLVVVWTGGDSSLTKVLLALLVVADGTFWLLLQRISSKKIGGNGKSKKE